MWRWKLPRRAGGLLMERYHSEKSISYKGRADLVTDVDLAAEGKILALLREEYPGLWHPLRGVACGSQRFRLYVDRRSPWTGRGTTPCRCPTSASW